MRSRLVSVLLVPLSLAFLGSAAEAAKGIIISAPPSGGGTVILTSTEGAPGILSIPGDEIPFAEPVLPAMDEGDAVTFDIIPSPMGPSPELAQNLRLLAEGTVITTSMTATVGVNANSPKIIRSPAVIDGKISVNGGVLVIVGGTVNGKIEGSTGGSIIIAGNTQVDGKIETGGCNLLKIDSSVIGGPVKSSNDSYITVMNCRIEGKLEILTQPSGGCNISNNQVSGQVNIPPGCGH